METRKSAISTPLPGYDALLSAIYFDPKSTPDLNAIQRFSEPGGYYHYLDNPDYRAYMGLSKQLTQSVSPETLLAFGEKLDTEEMPEYLRAAGSAYVEASLLAQSEHAVDRMAMATHGEKIWQRQLVNELFITRSTKFEVGDRNDYGGYRTAVGLATMPLVKSIIVGNVLPGVMDSVLVDVSRIAELVKHEYEKAVEDENGIMAGDYKGQLFEIIALMSALYLKDPRYIPLQSTARGGSGLYDAKQTHDIMVINQHWGDIRKVIPIEIKSRLTKRAKRRYQAMVVPGGLQLSIQEDDPSGTVDAFTRVVNGAAPIEEELAIEKIAVEFREALRLYQQGVVRINDLAAEGLLRFHSNETLVRQYPNYGTVAKKHY